MKKLLLCAVLVFSSYHVMAAPLDRSVREIRDIVGSPDLRRFIPPSESILEIQRVDRGYMIYTNRFQLYVEVIYGPRGAKADGNGGTPELKFNAPTEKR